MSARHEYLESDTHKFFLSLAEERNRVTEGRSDTNKDIRYGGLRDLYDTASSEWDFTSVSRKLADLVRMSRHSGCAVSDLITGMVCDHNHYSSSRVHEIGIISALGKYLDHALKMLKRRGTPRRMKGKKA